MSATKFKRLRVINFCDASDAKQLPTCFGNSKSLRYLDISGTQIKELPKFITKLYNLQTFRFTDCESLKRPPRGIGDLINLRHIYFDDEERMPANLGKLTNLQTLPLFFVGTTKGRKIVELGSLSGLKGRLEIHKLELVKDKSEAEKAKLHEKAVEDLKLRWSEREGNQDNDENVLEGLQPHSNLRRLSINGYGGRNLAPWMLKSSGESLLLNNIVNLSIHNCKMLDRIPGISGFSSLQRLSVSNCKGLTSLGDDDGALTLMSLKTLTIHYCLKLKSFSVSGLSSLESIYVSYCDELTSLGDGDEALTLMSLKTLSIRFCPKLKSFSALALSSLEELNIEDCNMMSSIGDSRSCSPRLNQLYLHGCPELKSIPSLEVLFSLKTVSIRNCDGLGWLPSGLSSCTALEELHIWSCRNLVSIPEELKQLPSLVLLEIWYCPKLRSFPEEILGSLANLKTLQLGPFSEEMEKFPNLSSTSTSTLASLEEMRLEGWGKVSLPLEIERLTALRDLTVTSFNGVEEASLGNLSCLKTLAIEDCSALRCVSGLLSSLEGLKIWTCPNLVSLQGELKELRSLTIFKCPKLVGFLEESLGCCTRLKTLSIGHFSEELEEFPSLSSIHASLEKLTLYGWEKLTHLPQIQHLTALNNLVIYNFAGMESLPDWFNNLSSLQRLIIGRCADKLKERCSKGSGPDWPKISHIPNIIIAGETIQSLQS